jgi:hypothetical protein
VGPVFDKIRNDPDEFATLTVDPELGVLCWSNGADIDSELLRYDDLCNEALPAAPSRLNGKRSGAAAACRRCGASIDGSL